MFGKSNQHSGNGDAKAKTSTVIAEGVTIKDGNLSGDGGRGGVTVAGVFFSNIDIEGVLIVSKSGSLKGDVKADSAYVYGTIDGNVSVKGKVYVYSEGKVTGDVLCSSFMVEEGAAFEGRCSNTAIKAAKLLNIKGAVVEQETKAASSKDDANDSK